MPFSVWNSKVRLSIDGYQDKLAVYHEDGRWFLVEDPHLASTLIVKPKPIASFMAGMTTNEFMCMHLAAVLKLPVANVHLRHVPEPVLVVERADRMAAPAADGSLSARRIHCIDGRQVPGLAVDFKYERPYGDAVDVQPVREGASLNRFFTLLGDKTITPAPGVSTLQFLRWVIFQVLLGNTDAHAKNMRFFCEDGRLTVAPAYDLVLLLRVQDVMARQAAQAMQVAPLIAKVDKALFRRDLLQLVARRSMTKKRPWRSMA